MLLFIWKFRGTTLEQLRCEVIDRERAMASHNLLLSAPNCDLSDLKPVIERVQFKRGDCIIRGHRPLDYIYFPEGGVASMLSSRKCERRAEVAVIGREGLCGAAALLMAESPAHDIILQVDDAWASRIPTVSVLAKMEKDAAFRRLILRYIQALFVQVASNAIANLSDRLEVRLARWLLMCHDRVDSDWIAITHDYMAMMIGSQRSAVTAVIHMLEGDHLVAADRGSVKILDRAGMETLTRGAYGFAEAEYCRLVTQFGKSQNVCASVFAQTIVKN
jgi:CRP-like cAMP-binding protein